MLIVLQKLTQQRSELNSIITVLIVFDKNVFDVFPENVEREVNVKEITNLDLEGLPNLFLVSCVYLHFFLVEHCDVRYKFDELLFRLKLFSSICHRDPIFVGSLFFSSNPELFEIVGEVHDRVVNNVLSILSLL